MLRFKTVEYIKTPSIDTKICFSCDTEYFIKYGQYNILSCIKTQQHVHCHVINPTADVRELANSLISSSTLVSISFELLDISLYCSNQILTYYFCARFYIARDLMINHNVSKLWITDTDVIFDQSIDFPLDKKLGVDYNLLADNLWKQTNGNIIFVHSSKVDFLNKVIEEYENRYRNINFSTITADTDKITRSNLIGLDQVSMAVVISKYYINDSEFSHVSIIPNLKGKLRGQVKVWIPVGRSKDCVRDDGFKNIKI
jgi:hypothetical protein